MSATTSAEYGEHEQPDRIMSGEMAQQPAVLRRILDEGAPRIGEVAARVAARKPRFVLLTARGTSDNAASASPAAPRTWWRRPGRPASRARSRSR